MSEGTVYEWHSHDDHQLAWSARGVLTIRSGASAWVLPPTRAMWIPAGVRHETLSDGVATMRSAYVRPERCSIDWTECTPVVATSLMEELLEYLSGDKLDVAKRARAERVLVDLLVPVSVVSFDVRLPSDERAKRIVDGLVDNLADERTLDEWGLEVGASARTLARVFLAETRLPFGRWRALLRLRTALELLAAGTSVSIVAEKVGYASASAFVAAFRRETGITPAAYFRSERDEG
jgi:AraC-like DNA-binding protein